MISQNGREPAARTHSKANKHGILDVRKMVLQPRWTASLVQWSEFLATDPEVLGSIPGATRFSEK
jgi:hypothetical protein